MSPDEKVVVPPVTPEATPVPAPTEDFKEVKDAIATISEKIEDLSEKIPAPLEPEPEPKPSWAPKSWDDIPALVEQRAKEITEQTLKDREDAAESARQSAEAKQKAIDEELDKMIADLETAGKLPKVVNMEDPNDLGRTARRELYGFAAHLGTTDLTAAQESLEKIHESGVTYDLKAGFIKSSPKPAGANVPIGSSSRASGGMQQSSGYTEEMRKAKTLDQVEAIYKRNNGY